MRQYDDYFHRVSRARLGLRQETFERRYYPRQETCWETLRNAVVLTALAALFLAAALFMYA